MDPSALQSIYDEVRTPFKYGVVLRGEGGKHLDSPSVFCMNDKWFMLYVCMNEVGYETHLAVSDNLTDWVPQGKVLSFPAQGWDRWQCAGGVALTDYIWGGTNALQQFNGKYWASYIGGSLQGYETDPLAIGIASITDPTQPVEWDRFSGNPVLSREQPDVRDFERMTLYRSNIIWDKEATLGFPFVMFYNGKIKSSYEKIGMAVSHDMQRWIRYGDGPVVANGEDKDYGISGDPQIVKIDDVWVMFYFGAFWKPKAFNTFACSHDLVQWTKWEGPNLIEPSEDFDQEYAHKPWVLKHEGVVYHFYCAVGDQGRVLALATSKDLRR